MYNVATQPRLIAIVDDDPGILRGLKRLLGAHGFAVETFESGEAFFERHDADDLACVVLDIQLGGITGIDVRRRLVAEGSLVPVVFMTAHDSAALRKAAVDSGCAGYLQKPFSGSELTEIIRKAIESRIREAGGAATE